MFTGKIEQGEVKIAISRPGQPHDPEFWAQLAAQHIMSVADTAPQPIRDQAYAFREQMSYIILDAIKAALRDHNAYVDVAKNLRG